MPHVLAAAVLAPRPGLPVPPPGVDSERWRAALYVDVVEVVDDLTGVTVVLAGGTDDPLPATVAWPGAVVLGVPAADPAALVAALDALARRGATIGAVLAGDAPDLPGLVVGKLFSACEDRPVGICPAPDGRLTGLAARLPLPDWLRTADVGLDTADALDRLHAVAPTRAIVVGPGWHRLRGPSDLVRLDADLEGWESTRSLLREARGR